MIGEIGGTAEEEAAAFVKEHVDKPVAAFIAGMTAPPGRPYGPRRRDRFRRQGNTAAAKIEAMQDAGIAVARDPSHIAEALFSESGNPERFQFCLWGGELDYQAKSPNPGEELRFEHIQLPCESQCDVAIQSVM